MARKAAQNGGKYGFFRFLRVLLLLLLTGFVILTITNPHYVLDKVESIQAEQHDESVAKRIQVDADIRLMLRKLLYALDADRTWLIELHNGSKTYHQDYRSYTAICESKRSLTASITSMMNILIFSYRNTLYRESL